MILALLLKGKRGHLGEHRTWGGKVYVKTAKGWRPLGHKEPWHNPRQPEQTRTQYNVDEYMKRKFVGEKAHEKEVNKRVPSSWKKTSESLKKKPKIERGFEGMKYALDDAGFTPEQYAEDADNPTSEEIISAYQVFKDDIDAAKRKMPVSVKKPSEIKKEKIPAVWDGSLTSRLAYSHIMESAAKHSPAIMRYADQLGMKLPRWKKLAELAEDEYGNTENESIVEAAIDWAQNFLEEKNVFVPMKGDK